MKLTPHLTALLRTVQAQIQADSGRYEQENPSSPACGSPSCLIGWLVYFHHRWRHRRVPRGTHTSAIDLFMRELRIDREAAYALVDSLYDANLWPEPFRAEYRATAERATEAAIAARRIDHFIAYHSTP